MTNLFSTIVAMSKRAKTNAVTFKEETEQEKKEEEEQQLLQKEQETLPLTTTESNVISEKTK
jgi:hypothetical protein